MHCLYFPISISLLLLPCSLGMYVFIRIQKRSIIKKMKEQWQSKCSALPCLFTDFLTLSMAEPSKIILSVHFKGHQDFFPKSQWRESCKIKAGINTGGKLFLKAFYPLLLIPSGSQKTTYAKSKGNNKNICWKYTLKKGWGELIQLKQYRCRSRNVRKNSTKNLLLLRLWITIFSEWGQQRSQSGIPKICGKVCAVTERCQCREKIFSKFGNSYWNRAANEIFLSLEKVAPLE